MALASSSRILLRCLRQGAAGSGTTGAAAQTPSYTRKVSTIYQSSDTDSNSSPDRQTKAIENEEQSQDAAAIAAFTDLPTEGINQMHFQKDRLKYYRLMEHEFPRLERFRERYQPPEAWQSVRIRTMHHQGVPHPVSNKASLEVDISDLYVSPSFTSRLPSEQMRIAAMRKLLHLAGSRWVFNTREILEPFRADGRYGNAVPLVGYIKMASDRFPHYKQNIEWCREKLSELVEEALQPDPSISDLPLDTRGNLHRLNKKLHKNQGKHRLVTIDDWPTDWQTPRKVKQPAAQTKRQYALPTGKAEQLRDQSPRASETG